MSTIYDVAELAGVSAKTVSRVLNEDGAVKLGTRERVLSAMSRLDYRPNNQARQLRLGQSKTSVGMLLEDPAGGYQSRFHHAMLMACMESGNYLAIELFEIGQTDFQGDFERFLVDAQIKSMVLLPPLCDFGPLKSLLKAHNIQSVLISPTTPDTHYASVAMDDRLAARDVTDYLLSLGHKKIAHIAGHPDHAAAFLRRQGFLRGFRRHRHAAAVARLYRRGLFNFRSGIAAAEKLLSLPDRPTAIFASNDEMAAAACSVAHKIGLRIPDDLAVVGFDDAPISSAVWPALTTVRQPYLDMARRSLAILNAAGDGIQASDMQMRHIVPHEIVRRESTATPRPGE
ncbi:MAG: LacI family DNA-binding transcriptional regulator [Asticcacaulis sp.]